MGGQGWPPLEAPRRICSLPFLAARGSCIPWLVLPLWSLALTLPPPSYRDPVMLSCPQITQDHVPISRPLVASAKSAVPCEVTVTVPRHWTGIWGGGIFNLPYAWWGTVGRASAAPVT